MEFLPLSKYLDTYLLNSVVSDGEIKQIRLFVSLFLNLSSEFSYGTHSHDRTLKMFLHFFIDPT